MDTYALIVIGSGPGGVGAATAYRQAGGAGTVLVLTADPDAPYMRPPLSKALLGSSKEPVPTPIEEDLGGIEVRVALEVTGLNLAARTLTAGGAEFGFDKLVLATGARPVRLPVMEQDVEHHQLRTLSDLRILHSAAKDARSAVVIGSGFIGCEAAASLTRRGLKVTVVTEEQAPQCERLGEHAADAISGWLHECGVTLRAGVEVASVRAPHRVHLSDGTILDPDLLLVVVGVEPVIDLVQGNNIAVKQGRVRANERLETTCPGVYAAGDIALADHPVAGRPIAVEHWGDAEQMGQIAGRNAAGAEEPWSAIPGFWSEIGDRIIKYAAWGDGYDHLEVVDREEAFTIWYADANGKLVGVLTHQADDDYERGSQLIEQGATLADALRSQA